MRSKLRVIPSFKNAKTGMVLKQGISLSSSVNLIMATLTAEMVKKSFPQNSRFPQWRARKGPVQWAHGKYYGFPSYTVTISQANSTTSGLCINIKSYSLFFTVISASLTYRKHGCSLMIICSVIAQPDTVTETYMTWQYILGRLYTVHDHDDKASNIVIRSGGAFQNPNPCLVVSFCPSKKVTLPEVDWSFLFPTRTTRLDRSILMDVRPSQPFWARTKIA